jgi:hypothetical protein
LRVHIAPARKAIIKKTTTGRGWGQGGEMTQALYAHMNNKTIKIKKKKRKQQQMLMRIQGKKKNPCSWNVD